MKITNKRAQGVNVRVQEKNMHAHKINSCALVYTHILVAHCHLVSLRIQFHKDPTISCGDIPLVVTLYNFENEKNLIF